MVAVAKVDERVTCMGLGPRKKQFSLGVVRTDGVVVGLVVKLVVDLVVGLVEDLVVKLVVGLVVELK